MSNLNPDVLMIPALPTIFDVESFTQVRNDLARVDVTAVPLPDTSLILHSQEYRLGVSVSQRRTAEQMARNLAPHIGCRDGLVIVNGATETVVDKKGTALAEVPNSVGYFAKAVISVANGVYGEQGRVFLSHGYPDMRELLSADDPDARPVVMARTRLLGLYPLRPVVLRGNMQRVSDTIRAGYQQS